VTQTLPDSSLAAGLDGRSIDGTLYTEITDQVAHTPHWLNDFLSFWATYGLGLFVILILWAWWRARGEGPARMAQALSVPVALVAGYVVNDIVKSVFTEERPCLAIPGTHPLQPCPGATDWAFPSNHSAIGMAAAVALLLVNRKIGAIAMVGALLLGFTRVWIGAHYPHDVLVGWIVGAVVGLIVTGLAAKAAPVVARLRQGPLRPLLAAG